MCLLNKILRRIKWVSGSDGTREFRTVGDLILFRATAINSIITRSLKNFRPSIASYSYSYRSPSSWSYSNGRIFPSGKKGSVPPEGKEKRKSDSRIVPLSIMEDRGLSGNLGCQMVAPSRAHTHTHTHKRADGEASEWTRLFRETGNCRLFPPPSLLLLFLSLSPRPFSLSLSIFLPPLSFCHGRVRTADFHATISAFRCAAIIGRCERKLVSLGQSFRGVVVVVVAVGGGGGGGLAQSPISKFRRESRRLFNELLHASSWSLRSINGHYATESFLL